MREHENARISIVEQVVDPGIHVRGGKRFEHELGKPEHCYEQYRAPGHGVFRRHEYAQRVLNERRHDKAHPKMQTVIEIDGHVDERFRERYAEPHLVLHFQLEAEARADYEYRRRAYRYHAERAVDVYAGAPPGEQLDIAFGAQEPVEPYRKALYYYGD